MAEIRITSDGTPQGTKVVDSHGDEIKGITEINWNLKAIGVASAVIRLAAIPLDAPAEASPTFKEDMAFLANQAGMICPDYVAIDRIRERWGLSDG